jgi:hypothetical protein
VLLLLLLLLATDNGPDQDELNEASTTATIRLLQLQLQLQLLLLLLDADVPGFFVFIMAIFGIFSERRMIRHPTKIHGAQRVWLYKRERKQCNTLVVL